MKVLFFERMTNWLWRGPPLPFAGSINGQTHDILHLEPTHDLNAENICTLSDVVKFYEDPERFLLPVHHRDLYALACGALYLCADALVSAICAALQVTFFELFHDVKDRTKELYMCPQPHVMYGFIRSRCRAIRNQLYEKQCLLCGLSLYGCVNPTTEDKSFLPCLMECCEMRAHTACIAQYFANSLRCPNPDCYKWLKPEVIDDGLLEMSDRRDERLPRYSDHHLHYRGILFYAVYRMRSPWLLPSQISLSGRQTTLPRPLPLPSQSTDSSLAKGNQARAQDISRPTASRQAKDSSSTTSWQPRPTGSRPPFPHHRAKDSAWQPQSTRAQPQSIRAKDSSSTTSWQPQSTRAKDSSSTTSWQPQPRPPFPHHRAKDSAWQPQSTRAKDSSSTTSWQPQPRPPFPHHRVKDSAWQPQSTRASPQRLLGSHSLARHSPITEQRTVLGSHSLLERSHSLLERRTPPQRLLGSHSLARHSPITEQRTPQRLLGSRDPVDLAHYSPIKEERTVLGSHSLLERRTPPQ